jgi:hypothetical protein
MSTEAKWHVFWGGFVGVLVTGFTTLDLSRERDDIRNGRTHSGGTTLSATIRWSIEHTRPYGSPVFVATCVGLTGWMVPHILKHLDNSPARF